MTLNNVLLYKAGHINGTDWVASYCTVTILAAISDNKTPKAESTVSLDLYCFFIFARAENAVSHMWVAANGHTNFSYPS